MVRNRAVRSSGVSFKTSDDSGGDKRRAIVRPRRRPERRPRPCGQRHKLCTTLARANRPPTESPVSPRRNVCADVKYHSSRNTFIEVSTDPLENSGLSSAISEGGFFAPCRSFPGSSATPRTMTAPRASKGKSEIRVYLRVVKWCVHRCSVRS